MSVFLLYKIINLFLYYVLCLFYINKNKINKPQRKKRMKACGGEYFWEGDPSQGGFFLYD